MNRIILTVASLLFANSLLLAQNGNNTENGNSGNALIHWKLNGNQATNSHFFGTVNEADLVFKTNATERLRISKTGEIIFPQLSNSEKETRLLTVDETGKTKAMRFKGAGGLLNQVYETDCFGLQGLDEQGNPSGPISYMMPTWASKSGVDAPGTLYTGSSCPVNVGINTANPDATLHVGGSGYFTSNMGIGINLISPKPLP